MAANYATNVYTTYAEWKAANDAATATKLVAVGVYRESGKNIFWNVIAA
jgi:hypothetical protein